MVGYWWDHDCRLLSDVKIRCERLPACARDTCQEGRKDERSSSVSDNTLGAWARARRPSRCGGFGAKTSPYLSRTLNSTGPRVRPRPSASVPPPSLSFPPSQRLMKGRMANGGEFSTQSQVREHLPPLDIFQSIVERLCVCTAARNCVSE